MYKLCNMRKWACLFLILSITLCALPGSADSIESDAVPTQTEVDDRVALLRTEIESLREEQRKLDLQISAEQEQVSGAVKQKTLMDQQIFLLSSEIACFDLILEHYDGLLASQEANYQALSASYDTHFTVLAERLRQSREEGNPGVIELFRNSETLLDLMVGLERLREIEEYDRSLMESLEEEQTAIADLRVLMEEYRFRRHMIALEQVERMQLLNIRLQDSGNFLQSLMDNVDRFSYYIQQSEAGKQLADRKIADLADELLERIAAEGADFLLAEKEAKLAAAGDAVMAQMEAGAVQKGDQFYADGHSYVWPLAIAPDRSPSVLSKMGYRTYQVGGKLFTAYHSGVDLGADYGSSVLAAASGKVIATDRADGYGDYVVILHDDGSQTRYSYLGTVLVKAGDFVLQGETIATAGVSGNSAGIGCHFELRIDGVIVDPLEYLTIPKAEGNAETTE